MNTKIETLLRKIVLADNIDDVRAEALDLLIENARSMKTDVRTIKGWDSDSVGGKVSVTYNLLSCDFDDIQALILQREKIQAIKKLRSITYWGLKTSKDAVEDYNNFRQYT